MHTETIYLQFSNLLYCLLETTEKTPEELLHNFSVIEFLFFRKFNKKLTDFNISISKQLNVEKISLVLELDINIVKYGEFSDIDNSITLKYTICNNNTDTHIYNYIKNSNFTVEEIIYLNSLINKINSHKFSYINYLNFYKEHLLGKTLFSNLNILNEYLEVELFDLISERKEILSYL